MTPNDNLTLNPISSYVAPIASGSSLLGGLAGATPYGAAIGAVSELGKAALADTPVNQTGTNKAPFSLQVSSPFQVGGSANSLANTPTLTASPIDSTTPAAGSVASAGLDLNTIAIVGAVILAVFGLLFGLRK